jgi:peroxiredoxin
MNTEPQSEVKPPKSKIWLRRGLELLLFIILIMGVRAWQQRDIVKGVAPALSGMLLDGKHFMLPAKPAQPVLVHFWAIWCPICRAEQGSIASLAHDNPNVVTIAMQSGNNSVVQQYMRDQEVSFPVVNDADNQISSAWGVSGVPASFIVDTDGKIRYVEIGYTTGMGLRFRLWLAGL